MSGAESLIMRRMRAALVIDHGHSRSALAAARGLAAAGWRVAIGSPAPTGPAPASRRVSDWFHVPGPEQGVDGFVAGVEAAARSFGAQIVFPSDDHQMIALSARREDIGARVPYAPHDVVMRALDKLELHRAACRAGLASPRTEEATPEALAAWRGPAVVKPRLHNPLDRVGAPTHLPVRRAHGRSDAERAAGELRAEGGAPLLQTLLPGEQIAVSVVADRDSRIVAAIQQRALRLFPAGNGISARAETVVPNDELLTGIRALVEELGWIGLVQLQFRAAPDGIPHLIDCNGRFYGSLALALRAGVNLPDAWARAALGEPMRGPAVARPGVRYQWLEGDLRAALAGPGPCLEAARALGYAARAGHSVWDWRDPRPGGRLAAHLPRRALRAVRNRLRSTNGSHEPMSS